MISESASYEVLNKDGEFEKFFKEYLENKSNIEVAGRTRATRLWPIMEEALKTVPKNASLKEKYNAIKNFSKRDSQYGYKSSFDHKVGRRLGAAIKLSFEDAQKGFGKLNIKQLADEIPAYSYKTLQAIFGNSKKNPNKYKGNAKQNIINSKLFIEKLKDAGVVISQGEITERTKKGTGSGKAYLFEPLTEETKLKLKEFKPLRSTKVDYDNLKFRRLVEAFSRASEDYKKFGFSKNATVLTEAANSLNRALLEEFTSKNFQMKDSKGATRNIATLNSAMSKKDVENLRQFIEDNPKIKNKLSIMFDPTGKNGTYFKPRDLSKLSGGQLLKDILVEKDHIFPIKEVEVLEKPTKTSMGVLKGGALSETPFNKTLSTSYFNNSLRNKIQTFLNSGGVKQEAIDQINNTLQGLDTTIYHGGKYYGGKISPLIETQINRLGYDKFNVEDSVIRNIKFQDVIVKNLKKQKFSDMAIRKALKNSRFAFPFVLGAAGLSAMGGGSAEAAEVKQPEVGTPIKYDENVGAIVNERTDQPATQNQILTYIKDNPLKVTAGTSLAFAAEEIPGAYKAARNVGRGKVRSALGITGALKPVLTTIGTPAMTALFEAPFAAKRLEEGESATEILTDPLGPALGVAFMEPFSRGAGVIRGAPKRTMAEGLRNYFNLSNVGQARPGVTSKVLRLGMSPRMIAGASRFLGIPGLLLGAGLSGYDAYKNYQNQEGFLYNLLNKDE